MEDRLGMARAPARNAAQTLCYARVWKAMVSGDMRTEREELAEWYGAAQHVIGMCLHDADVDRVVLDVAQGPGDVRHAA